jgi:hypothetical protein
VFLFPNILAAFILVCAIDGSYSEWGVVELQCCFDVPLSSEVFVL